MYYSTYATSYKTHFTSSHHTMSKRTRLEACRFTGSRASQYNHTAKARFTIFAPPGVEKKEGKDERVEK
jgi:hypothetical protein